MITVVASIDSSVFSVVPTHIGTLVRRSGGGGCRWGKMTGKSDRCEAATIWRPCSSKYVSPGIVVIIGIFFDNGFQGNGQFCKTAFDESGHHALDTPHFDRTLRDDCSTYWTVLPPTEVCTVPGIGAVQNGLNPFIMSVWKGRIWSASNLRVRRRGEPPYEAPVACCMATRCERIWLIHEVETYLTSNGLLMVRQVSLMSLEKLGKYISSGRDFYTEKGHTAV
jgi:hypothetical protein